MRKIRKVVYSEYTLKKFKEYVSKHIDRIDINYDVIYLYKKDIYKFERIEYNQQLIDYILNDRVNFYKIDRNIIINKNMIEYAYVDGYYEISSFNWYLEVFMPSETIKLIYDGSKESYNFLEEIRKEIYPEQKIKFTIIEKIFLILILIGIIELFYFLLHIKLF